MALADTTGSEALALSVVWVISGQDIATNVAGHAGAVRCELCTPKTGFVKFLKSVLLT